MEKVYNLTLPVIGYDNVMLKGNVVQNDEDTNKIIIRLVNPDNRPFTISTAATIQVSIMNEKKNSTTISEGSNLSIDDREKGIVSLLLNKASVAYSGLCQAELALYENSKRATSSRFTINIVPDIGSESAGTVEEQTTLGQLILQANTTITEATGATTAANNAASNTTTAANSANTAATAANNAASSANAAASQATSKAGEADTAAGNANQAAQAANTAAASANSAAQAANTATTNIENATTAANNAASAANTAASNANTAKTAATNAADSATAATSTATAAASSANSAAQTATTAASSANTAAAAAQSATSSANAGAAAANTAANTASTAATNTAASMATPYSSTSTYNVGDFCSYSGKMYKCSTAIATAESWTAAHWTETTAAGQINAFGAKTDFTLTAKTGYTITSQKCYKQDGKAYMCCNVQKTDGTTFDTSLINFASLPFPVTNITALNVCGKISDTWKGIGTGVALNYVARFKMQEAGATDITVSGVILL